MNTDTVQVWLDKDSMYPVFDYATEAQPWRSGPFTVPRDLTERYDKALIEWQAVQAELEKIYNADASELTQGAT